MPPVDAINSHFPEYFRHHRRLSFPIFILNRCASMAHALFVPLALALALNGLLAAAANAADAPLDHRAVATELAQKGDALLTDYDPANGGATADAFSDLYFSVFEESGLEADIGAVDPAAKTDLEAKFAAVVTLAVKKAPRESLQEAWMQLRTALIEVADMRAAAVSGWVGAFLQSLLILLREGFEAILVISALVAYLKRLGADDKVKVVWQAVGVALLASAAMAWAMNSIITLSGSSRETMEGVTMLVAALVLTYVSHWLFARREAQRWQGYIKDQIEKALSGGQMFSLGFAAFLAVFREGAETVLFYQALAGAMPGQGVAIAGGFLVGALGLVALYWLMSKASLKIPLGPFFTATAALLFVLAVVFAGRGVLELQGARWLSATPIAWMPSVSAIGLFPTVEAVLAQLLLLASLLPAMGFWILKRRRGGK